MHECTAPLGEGWQVLPFKTVELREKRSEYCICIPVLNEGGRIKAQLERMRPFSDLVDIIIADGGSTDGSMEYDFLRQQNVRAFLILGNKAGQGSQLRMAFAYALLQGYRGILQVDGNNKDGVEAIPQIAEALHEGCDYVQGSRFIPGGAGVKTPFLRYVAVRFFASPLLSLSSGRWYTDVTNGFRGYSRNYLLHPMVQPFRDIFVKYELILYLAVRANQLGLKSKEIPVSRVYPSGKVPTKISFFKGNFGFLATIVRVALGYYHSRH